MFVSNDLKEMRNIIEKLHYYTKKYDEGNPVVTDKEWDDLYFKLFDLEQKTGEYYADSPTQSIPFSKVSELKKVKHNHPMLSLQKTKSIDELNSFVHNKDFVVMLKLDGLTCSLQYDKGELISAETRGNGEIGEDITHNAFVVSNIPKKIPFKGKLTVDGEIICLKTHFKKFEQEYKNPRNFAAGSIRLLDPLECKQRDLSFITWDVISAEHVEFKTLVDKFNFLSNNNFSVVSYDSTIDTIDESFINDFIRFNNDYYPMDGLVIKYNDCKTYENAGKTEHHFKGGIAYKFYEDYYKTTLLNIEWTMGRTGVLTPIAIFEPVDIDGTICERASLHNVSIMHELSGGFERKGDILYIFKAHSIIPQVGKWEHIGDFKEENHLELPIECPICGGVCDIIQENETKVMMCMNELCEGKLINRLDHFCGKKGLDIKGLSKATLDKLISWNWITNFEDIFNLYIYASEWKTKTGFGEKSVNNILEAINKSKKCELYKFIAALGIPLIGVKAAKDLANKFKTWSGFMEAIDNDYKFYELPDFGIEMHKSISTFKYNEAIILANNYLNFEENKEQNSGNALQGQSFVITGKLNHYKNRNELKQIIESNGGKVSESISKNTTALINNDINSTSSKNNAAKKIGIPIITEEEFQKKLFEI